MSVASDIGDVYIEERVQIVDACSRTEESMLSIGERVRRLRREQDITQATLAKRAGLWTNTVNRVEKDHVVPSSETLAKIAHGLGVSVGELYPEEPAGKDDPLSGAGVSEVERRGLERLAALLDSLGAESADLANPRLTQELESLPSQQFLAALHQLQEEIDVLTPVLDEMREATTPRDPNYLDFTYLWSSAARQFHLIKMLVRARAHVEPQIEQAREVRELLEVIP